MNTKRLKKPLFLMTALSAAIFAVSANAAELTAFALMPANTFAVGPTSGQFAGTGAGGNSLPLIKKQPVQGVSAILHGPTHNSYYIMQDNGFGAKTNSADTILRVFAVRPDFKTWDGSNVVGSGEISPVNFLTGDVLPSFTKESFISLRDPNHKLGFTTVADADNYPNGNNDIPVAASIKARHFLTGADLDIEAVRKDKRNHFWFGDEFGPFLVETDRTGKVLHAEVSAPNYIPAGSTATGDTVMSPQNPYLGTAAANLGQSRGFEGMAVNPIGDKLYPLFEGTVTGDDAINGTAGKNLRIYEFNLKNRSYTGKNWVYQLETDGTNIGDMTAINDHQFLVLERNGVTATSTSGTPFKKVFLIDIAGVESGSFVTKTELANLMNIADPHDLNGDSSTRFTFPFVTIESVLPLDSTTLLITNDNNYPGAGGRDLNSDNNEFIKIKLDTALDLATFAN
ncbi:MAG: esterase-like activity of phytase family protein [Methylovulum sp.]|nr:esterase-like activity of phytase family protein [Methylovulum sp.]